MVLISVQVAAWRLVISGCKGHTAFGPVKRTLCLLCSAGLLFSPVLNIALDSEEPSDLTTAGDLFRSLYQKDSNDRIAIAGYVASKATLDYSQIESQLNELPEVDDLIADIDVSALESAGIAPSASSAAAGVSALEPLWARRPFVRTAIRNRLREILDARETRNMATAARSFHCSATQIGQICTQN